jgi:hypothetical protein
VTWLPWKSFQMQSDLTPEEFVRLLGTMTPAYKSYPKLTGNAPYFCGTVDPAAGVFRLQRKSYRKGRGLLPVMHGVVVRAAHGTNIQIAIRPGIFLWFSLVFPCGFLAFIPLGILSWLSNPAARSGDLIASIMIPLFGVAFTSWIWLPALIVSYVLIPRYRLEFSNLVSRMVPRAPAGLSIFEAPETPEQRAANRVSRGKANQAGLRMVSVCLAVLGSTMLLAGVKGLLTGELTIHSRSRPHHAASQTHSVSLSGEEAAHTSQAFIAFGAGLGLAGIVSWLVARHDLSRFARDNLFRKPCPLLETVLLAGSVLLLALGVTLGVKAFW